MTYDLSSPLDLQRYKTRDAALRAKGAVVELTEKTGRTRDQNAYLHLVLGAVAVETGVTLEYCKNEYFKKLVNPATFVVRMPDRFLGEVTVLRSSTALTVEEMRNCIDRFKRWAAEQGIYIPDREDTARLRDLEVEMGRMQGWL